MPPPIVKIKIDIPYLNASSLEISDFSLKYINCNAVKTNYVAKKNKVKKKNTNKKSHTGNMSKMILMQ